MKRKILFNWQMWVYATLLLPMLMNTSYAQSVGVGDTVAIQIRGAERYMGGFTAGNGKVYTRPNLASQSAVWVIKSAGSSDVYIENLVSGARLTIQNGDDWKWTGRLFWKRKVFESNYIVTESAHQTYQKWQLEAVNASIGEYRIKTKPNNNWRSLKEVNYNSYSNDFKATESLNDGVVFKFIKEVHAPTMPTSFVATSITPTSVQLSWDASTDDIAVAHYEFYQNDILLTSISALSSSATSFNAQNLVSGTAYTFKVKAIDAAGKSSAFHILSVETKPKKPTNFVIDNATSYSLDLSWESAEGASEYIIYNNEAAIATTNTTSYTLKGLVDDMNHTFTVKSSTTTGKVSDPISSNNTTTVAPTFLGANYEGLAQNREYYIKFTAFDELLNGETNSGPYWSILGNVGQMGAPVRLSAESQAGAQKWFVEDAGDNFFYIKNIATNSYLTLDISRGNGMVLVKELEPSSDAQKWYYSYSTEKQYYQIKSKIANTGARLVYNKTSGTLENTNLESSFYHEEIIFEIQTQYVFKFKDDGDANYFQVSESMDPAGHLPVFANATTPIEAAKWILIEGENDLFYIADPVSGKKLGRDDDRGYDLAFDGDTEVLAWKIVESGDAFQVIPEEISRTSRVALYKFGNHKIEIIDDPTSALYLSDILIEEASDPIDSQNPTQPTNVEANNITETSVTLSWSPAYDNIGVVDYEICAYDANMVAICTDPGTVGNSQPYIFTGLEAGTTYFLVLTAVDAAGNKNSSLGVEILTQGGAFEPISNLRAQNITAHSAELLWDILDTNDEVELYEVYQDDELLGEVNNNRYTALSLTGNQTYAFKVRAKSTTGIFSAFSELPITTPDYDPSDDYIDYTDIEGSFNVADLFGGFFPERAFNNDLNNAWLAVKDGEEEGIQINFNEPKLVKKISITSGDASYGLKSFYFEGSIDGVSWRTLMTVPNVTWANDDEEKEFSTNLQAPLRYYRLIIFRIHADDFVVMANVDLLGPSETPNVKPVVIRLNRDDKSLYPDGNSIKRNSNYSSLFEWSFEESDEGSYHYIKNLKRDEYAAIETNNLINGTPIKLIPFDPTNSDRFKWKVEVVEDGTFVIRPKLDLTKAFDSANGSDSPTRLWDAASGGNANTKWKINFPSISTNPDSPYVPPHKLREDWQLNQFDWTNTQWSIKADQEIASDKSNPFLQNADHMKAINSFYNVNTGDYHWEDGWELIIQRLGHEYNGTEISESTKLSAIPHVIFYNRYQGIIRVLGYKNTSGGGTANLAVRLELVNGTTGQSTLLAHEEGRAISVAPQTAVFSNSKIANTGNREWFYADFNVAFDPCLDRQSTIQVKFYNEFSGEVELQGRSYGTSTPASMDAPFDGEEFLYGGAGNGRLGQVAIPLNTELQNQTYDNVAREIIETPGSLEDNPLGLAREANWMITAGTALLDDELPSVSPFTGKPLKDPITGADLKIPNKFKGNLKKLAGVSDHIGLVVDVISFFQGSSAVGQSFQLPPPQPYITFSEMRHTGTITSTSAASGNNSWFSLPGAEVNILTEVATSLSTPATPIYNETLGILNLVKQPKITLHTYYERYDYQREVYSYFENRLDACQTHSPVISDNQNDKVRMTVKAKLQEYIYVTVNDKIDIDWANSNLVVSLKIQSKYNTKNHLIIGPFYLDDQMSFTQAIEDSILFDNAQRPKYGYDGQGENSIVGTLIRNSSVNKGLVTGLDSKLFNMADVGAINGVLDNITVSVMLQGSIVYKSTNTLGSIHRKYIHVSYPCIIERKYEMKKRTGTLIYNYKNSSSDNWSTCNTSMGLHNNTTLEAEDDAIIDVVLGSTDAVESWSVIQEQTVNQIGFFSSFRPSPVEVRRFGCSFNEIYPNQGYYAPAKEYRDKNGNIHTLPSEDITYHSVYNAPNNTRVANKVSNGNQELMSLESLQVNAYPNPTSDKINFDFALPKAGAAKLVLYNMMGQAVMVVAEGEMRGGINQVTADVSGLDAGIYIYRLESSQGEPTSGRIVVR